MPLKKDLRLLTFGAELLIFALSCAAEGGAGGEMGSLFLEYTLSRDSLGDMRALGRSKRSFGNVLQIYCGMGQDPFIDPAHLIVMTPFANK